MPHLSIEVPFDFVVSGKTLPAGQYVIVRDAYMSPTPTFVIRNARTKKASMALISYRTGQVADKAEVVFNCVENKCYFRELKIAGLQGYVATVPRMASRMERVTSIPLRSPASAD
ncbi:MAG: hypothetical protein ABI972_30170 [Acidobacteriota bacterium]